LFISHFRAKTANIQAEFTRIRLVFGLALTYNANVYIPRAIKDGIVSRLNDSNNVAILYGPRQVGKTTLAREILSGWPGRALAVSADEPRHIDVLSSRDSQKLKSLVAGYSLLFIDEAQRVPDIGINLKILHDEIPDLRVIATGSSSFDLASRVREPLTGRAWTYNLYPISFQELSGLLNRSELDAQLEDRLIYGSYPEVFSIANRADREDYLYELGNAYLYKDVLELSSIRNSSKIRDLVRLLAYQVGSEVSRSEIGTALGMGKETVGAYIDLLEKSFVVFRLRGLHRDLRKEISRNDKIYFYDLGVRNMVIGDFKPLNQRNDVGALWENFLIVERMKKLAYSRTHAQSFFWRTYTGAELDYVEERSGRLIGYEFKYGAKTIGPPKAWSATYPEAGFELINRDSYLDFALAVTG
jgi:predicted AAA+ superfamily ATPase